MIKVLRIDDRLVHAQVTFGWMQSLNIKGILIVSDIISNSSTMKTAVQLAKPQGVKLWIKSLEDSIAAINKMNTFNYNTMVLVENVPTAKKLTEKSEVIPFVNMGGQRVSENRYPILDTIYVSDDDLRDLQAIKKLGIKVLVQKVITDEAHELEEFVH